MNAPAILLPASRQPPLTFGRLLALYLALVLVPYALSLTEGLGYRGIYATLLTACNLMGLAALLAQFPLAGRLDAVTRHTGLDNGMRLHRTAGEWVAIFFFLHPFLIVLPRYLVAPQKATGDIWTSVTAWESATGLYAWALMGVWVLMASYRRRFKLSYEAWRLAHGVGLVAVAILATHHAVTVGRHGRYDAWFDAMWVTLCALAVAVTLRVYAWQPILQKRRPFKVAEVRKLGASDWGLTIEKDGEFDFDFDAGQFVWLNTTGNPFVRAEHPFSIASSPTDRSRLSFVIRELGDFTSRLGSLKVGQRVFVDGPHGVFTLVGRKAGGIALIAGGAGIGPILGIARQLRDLRETRPVRLVYANRRYEQMVCQDELEAMEASLADFRQRLVLEKPVEGIPASIGFIDRELLATSFERLALDTWVFYVCGPPAMVEAVAANLRALGVSEQRILFEQLAF